MEDRAKNPMEVPYHRMVSMFASPKYKKLVRDFHLAPEDDPVYHCLLYIYEGCNHVDGYLCDYDTCKMRIEWLAKHPEEE